MSEDDIPDEADAFIAEGEIRDRIESILTNLEALEESEG